MKDLAEQLSDAAGAAFARAGLDPALGAMRRSDRPDLADFQCNGAMAALKLVVRGLTQPQPQEFSRLLGEDRPSQVQRYLVGSQDDADALKSKLDGEISKAGGNGPHVAIVNRWMYEGSRPNTYFLIEIIVARSPRDIASIIVDELKASPMVAHADVAGPGFINIRLSAAALDARAAALASDDRAGAPKVDQPRRVVMDFGGWNVAKPMHIGHLRSTIIGDSLQRLFRFMGDTVTSDVHLGDWGLQMGQLINEVKLEQPDLPYFDAALTGPYPNASPVSMEDLERLYPLASGKSKADETRRNEDRKATAELQAKRPGYYALWQKFCDVTRVGLERECASLGVTFNWWKGESDAEPYIPELVADLKKREIAVLDEGAWIVRVARESDKKEMPPFLLVNRDGAVGYHATDLGTILDRKRTVDPELTLYIVDQRQALHFEQVFRASELAGYQPESTLEHLGFGTMNGKDGKPFKTREGGVLKLYDLINQADEAALARMKEAGIGADAPEAEQKDIAHKVGMAALKFADLSNVRTTNYVFDLDRFISFEGKTGPYLLYAAVRMKSLARRAAEEGVKPGAIKVELDAERALVLALDAFPDALRGAYDKRLPHILCDHAYTLAQAFSGFYAAAPVMVESDPAKKASRFALVLATLRQLETVLGLVGIETPERM